MGNYRTSPGDILSMLDGESVRAQVSPKKAFDAGAVFSQLPLASGLPPPTKDPLDFPILPSFWWNTNTMFVLVQSTRGYS